MSWCHKVHLTVYVTCERFIDHYLHDYLLTFSIDLQKFSVEKLLSTSRSNGLFVVFNLSIKRVVHRIDLTFSVNTLHQNTHNKTKSWVELTVKVLSKNLVFTKVRKKPNGLHLFLDNLHKSRISKYCYLCYLSILIVPLKEFLTIKYQALKTLLNPFPE